MSFKVSPVADAREAPSSYVNALRTEQEAVLIDHTIQAGLIFQCQYRATRASGRKGNEVRSKIDVSLCLALQVSCLYSQRVCLISLRPEQWSKPFSGLLTDRAAMQKTS